MENQTKNLAQKQEKLETDCAQFRKDLAAFKASLKGETK